MKLTVSFDDVMEQRISMGNYQWSNLVAPLLLFFYAGVYLHLLPHLDQGINQMFPYGPPEQLLTRNIILAMLILGQLISRNVADGFGRKVCMLLSQLLCLVAGLLSVLSGNMT